MKYFYDGYEYEIGQIYKQPNPILYTVCDPVESKHFGQRYLKDFVLYMKHSMIICKGIGLAAPQVGVCKRLFVAKNHITGKITEYINPTIVPVSDKEFGFKEGCLSLPGIFAVVKRPKEIEITYFDVDGVEHKEFATDLYSTVLQHEYDHLDGILFIDKAGKYSRKKAFEKFNRKKK